MSANSMVQELGLRALGGALLLGAAAAVIGVAGCSADTKAESAQVQQTPVLVSGEAAATPAAAVVLDKAQLQFKVSMQLAQANGRVPDLVRCAGGLEMSAGSTQQCAVSGAGVWLPATVTALDDRNLRADVGTTPIAEPAY